MTGLKIALIGFMGCGKTCVGGLLASRISSPFLDLDEEIERTEGRSITDIFTSEGESAFRRMESDALASVARRKGDLVLSCGGGVVLAASNRQTLAREYLTIWIDVPLEELLRRLSREREGRPLLKSGDFQGKAKALLESRLPLYREASALIYSWKEGESTSDSASAIMRRLVEEGWRSAPG